MLLELSALKSQSLLTIFHIAFAPLTSAIIASTFVFAKMQMVTLKIIAMTEVQKLAKFVQDRNYGDLSKEAVKELKIRLLDSIGCAIGAMDGAPIKMLKAQIDDFGGNP